jgi:hypothetical protein
LVTVHTSDWQRVKFAVEYTDAAGQRWKQHLGGHIERVLATNAVPVQSVSTRSILAARDEVDTQRKSATARND